MVQLFGLLTFTAKVFGFAVTRDGVRVPLLQGAPSGRDFQYACLGLQLPIRAEVLAAFAGKPDLEWEDRFAELGDLAGNPGGDWDAILGRAVLPRQATQRLVPRPDCMRGSGLIAWQTPDQKFHIAKANHPNETVGWKEVPCQWFIAKRFAQPGVVFPGLTGRACGERVPCRRWPTGGAAQIRVTVLPEPADIVELRTLVDGAGLGDVALAIGIAYRQELAAKGHPPGQIALARLVHVDHNVIRPHLNALGALAPHLFADHVPSRREDLELLMAGQAEVWAGVVGAIDEKHYYEERDAVALEVASACLLGDWMPETREVAERCGLEEELVSRHLAALRLDFEWLSHWLPHEHDDRQTYVDSRFGNRPSGTSG
jgi:hypothetical protein